MAKFNLKQAAIDHCEKAVFGLVMLFVVLGLAGTDWSAYTGTPHDILVKVEQCKVNISQAVWPEEEKAKYELTAASRPENIVRDQLFASINPGDYEASRAMFADGLAPKKPVTEIECNAPEQAIATTARVLIEVLPPEEETESDPQDALASAVKPEEDDPNMLDEFRERKNAGPAGYEMGTEAFYAPDAYDPYAGMDLNSMMAPGEAGYEGMEGMEGMGMGGMAMQKKNGKGYPFVSVRAIYKVRDQISKFAEAMHVSYHEAARYFYIIDFKLERQVMQSGDDPWPADQAWEPVDIKVAEDVLNEAVGFDAETVNSIITDPVITMPLPMRVTGVWKTQATHPAIAKFELNDEQINMELELNSLMIQKALEQRKAVRETQVKRGGFTNMMFNSNELQANMMGMDSMYDMGGMGMGGMGMGGMSSGNYAPPGAPGGMGMGGGRTRPGASRTAKAGEPANQRLDQLLDQLVDKDQSERRDKLKEWIQTRAKAEGELLLFRYLDFSVTPGKTYRYRVKFVIPNPNFGRRIADAGGIAAVVEGETRESEWCDPTEPVTVPADTRYFLASVKPAANNSLNHVLPTVFWDVYQYDHAFGTTMTGKFEVRVGQKVGEKINTEVIKPAENFYDREEYTFKSDDLVVDVIDSLPLDRAFHAADPDTGIAKPLNGGQVTSGQALVLTSDGVKAFDGMTGQSDKVALDQYVGLQKESYEKIKEAQEKMALATEGSALDPYGGQDEMMMMMGDMGGSRQRNVLRKSKGSSSSSSRRSMPPGRASSGGRSQVPRSSAP